MNDPQARAARPIKHRYFATVPTQEILPIINADYRSSAKGVYVIGDVTGVPLVKVAANHGVDVIERMVARNVFQKSDTDDGSLDLVIVGAGPAGLSAAMEAQARGLRYLLLERALLANTIHGFPPGKLPFFDLPLQLGDLLPQLGNNSVLGVHAHHCREPAAERNTTNGVHVARERLPWKARTTRSKP